MTHKPLTHKQEKFAQMVVATGNQSEAYRRAYAVRASTEPEQVTKEASALMQHPGVAGRVKELQAAAANVAVMTAADVLSQWIQLATANPADLVQHHVTCCRHCYGVSFAYQWRPTEYAEACDKALRDETELPDCLGDWFDGTLPPHPKCPECDGLGIEEVRIKDTRELTGSARLLYGGVKKTRNGIEVIMRDQDGALEKIAKHLGMLKDSLQLTAPGVEAAVVASAASPADAMKSYLSMINGPAT